MDPNEILTKEVLSKPQRTIIKLERQIETLNQNLKQAIIQELMQTQSGI